LPWTVVFDVIRSASDDLTSPIMRTSVLFISLVLVSIFTVALSMASGSVPVGWHELLSAVHGGGNELAARILFDLRWPRTAAAYVTGALLALAGGLMQVLLRNPLADPYVLGVSGGAAVAALLALLLGLGSIWLQGAAFSGALLSMALVFGLSHGRGSWNVNRLLLTGVVVAAGWGAAISFLLALSPEENLRGMLFWLMGDLSSATVPREALAVLLIGLLVAFASGRSLNLLAHGELVAATLGVSIQPLRRAIYVLASLLTATAVMNAGTIGFIGLIVPHMLRLQGVRDHRRLLPAAALLGGSLLVLADTLARTLLAPRQLPVGILTALIGVPVFLSLLYHGREHFGRDG
jgi:iron complex transport system permease protein